MKLSLKVYSENLYVVRGDNCTGFLAISLNLFSLILAHVLSFVTKKIQSDIIIVFRP